MYAALTVQQLAAQGEVVLVQQELQDGKYASMITCSSFVFHFLDVKNWLFKGRKLLVTYIKDFCAGYTQSVSGWLFTFVTPYV